MSVVDSRIRVRLPMRRVESATPLPQLPNHNLIPLLLLPQLHYLRLQPLHHLHQIRLPEILQILNLPLHRLVHRVILLYLRSKLIVHPLNLLVLHSHLLPKLQHPQRRIHIPVTPIVLLQQLGQLQLQLQHLSVVLLQLVFEVHVLLVETPVYRLRGVAPRLLDETSVHANHRTTGKQLVSYLRQFTQIQPSLLQHITELACPTLHRPRPSLRQVPEYQRHNLQHRLTPRKQLDHVLDVGLYGERASQLLVFDLFAIELKQ
jgi:hypothetical protein